MKINITEVTASVRLASGEKKHQNLLAYATLTFRGELGEYFTVSGFTVWKSQYEGLNVEVPQKKFFKYCLFEKALMVRIKKEILDKYDYASIPIVEEK